MSLEVVGAGSVELARVSGREGVAGPLQEGIELVVMPKALILRRGRILQALRGGRSEKRIPLADIERVEPAGGGGVTLIPRKGTRVGPARTLHGTAAVTALAAWWATLGRPDVRLVGAPATFVGSLGVARSGFALGGPAGVVFVPTGWAGTVDDTLVRIPLPTIAGVSKVNATHVRIHGDYPGELRLDAAVATIDALASWLGRVVETLDEAPRVGGLVAQDVIWQLDEQEAWRSFLSVTEGKVSLRTTRGPSKSIQVPVGRVERLRLDIKSRDPVFVGRVDGQVHTLRPLGSVGGLERMDRLLRAGRGDINVGTVDLYRWQRLAGSHRAARLFRGAEAEGTLQQVDIKVTAQGVRLRGRPRSGALATRHLEQGSRIRVSLPQGRGWQHFSATVRQLVHKVGDAATIDSVDLLLIPIADTPTVGNGRRAFHRVSLADSVPFTIQRLKLTEATWFQGEMLDLSAGGFGATVPRRVSVGDQFRVELPMKEWCPPLEAEVVHCRKVRGTAGHWSAGFRLLGVTEKHRAMLQREVLRYERAQLAEKRRVEREQQRARSAAASK